MKELKCFQRDEITSALRTTLRVHRPTLPPFSSLITAGRLLVSEKICFLPNEPKLVQCLPRKLEKQLRAKRTKTGAKPIKTDAKPTQMMSKPPPNDTFYRSLHRLLPLGTHHSLLVTHHFFSPLKTFNP
jgi:hypothetical protein